MRNLIAALLLLTIAGPVMADDALTPTEGGEQTDHGGDLGGAHQTLKDDDNNPETPAPGTWGEWTSPGGVHWNICCEDDPTAPGSWYQGGVNPHAPGEAAAGHQGRKNMTNGGGNDHSKTRD